MGWVQKKAGEVFGLTRTSVETIDGKLQMQKSVICQQSTIKVADKIRPET